MSQVLFLCTGNYYRSRYAEILFNHLAPTFAVSKRADSRGLMVDVYGQQNHGLIALFTLERLNQAGIVCPTMQRSPLQVVEADLERAEVVIAMKEEEHRPMILQRFPRWVDRVCYWGVHDAWDGPIDQALDSIDQEVRILLQQLAAVK